MRKSEEQKVDDAQKSIIKNCLRMQLEEYELLSSIYCNNGEFRIFDPTVLEDIRDFLNDLRTTNYRNLDYVIKLKLNDKIKCELSVELTQFYPMYEIPIFIIRTDCLSKKQEDQLKKSIERHINENIGKEDPYIYQVITWMQDNIDDIVKMKEVPKEAAPKEQNLARVWIYSHHIKNKTKRTNIIRHAREYNLRGFMLPGKPGVICLEGPEVHAMECWKIFKSWQWQKIKIIKTETLKTHNGKEAQDFFRFKDFREIMFVENDPENGIEGELKEGEETKMSMSLFVKYLEAHKSGYMTKEIFGFE